MPPTQPPRDDIVRSIYPGPEFRAAATTDDGIGLMSGHFAVFNQWTEIRSAHEGHFLERIAPGAFDEAFADHSSMRALFQHGKDPQIGDKPLGPIRTLVPDGTGAYFEVSLLDTSYNRDLLPGLRAGLYGASFRFGVGDGGDTFDRHAKKSAHNPKGLPERTITRARVHEFGPVTFPAYAGASASVRSGTDDYLRAVGAPTPTPKGTTVPSQDYVTRDEKASRVTELKGTISARAVEHPGVFPADVQTLDDAENAELDQHVRDIAAWDNRQARLATFANDTTRTESVGGASYAAPTIIRKVDDPYDMSQYGPGRVRSAEDLSQKLRDNAMRSLDISTFAQSNVDQSRAKEGVQDLLDNHDTRSGEIANRILLTGSPQYKRAFAESVQFMRPTQRLEEARAAALAVTGTTTTGGYMLPYTFDPTFIKTGAWTNINPFRQICRVETITGSNNWQGVSVGAVPAIYETEALAVTEAGPTFARPSVTAQRASSFVSLSYETLQDRPDVVSEIADLIQEGKDTLEEAQFSVGVGTTVYPLGMFVKSTFTVKETITNDTFAVADLDATEAALPIRHRRDAVWMLSRGVIRIIQGWETAYGKLFNSTLGYPAVGDIKNNPGGNTGLSLLGYPVWETPSAPITVTTDDTIVGILVAPKNYIIVDRVGMNVELIQNLVDGSGLPTGQRGILALWRNSAKALNADAGRQININ